MSHSNTEWLFYFLLKVDTRGVEVICEVRHLSYPTKSRNCIRSFKNSHRTEACFGQNTNL